MLDSAILESESRWEAESNRPKLTTFRIVTNSRFFQFGRYHNNWLISFLYNERLRRILLMMIPLLRERSNQSVILDIGCGRGEFACILSLVFDTIGLDVKKYDEFRLLKKSKRLNFVIADVRFLPFRYGSIDVAVCNSILEHCRNLENDMKKIANVLKKDGVLVGGYPVETALFKFVWKRVSPRSYSVIDMEGARKHAWINPWTGRKENYWEKPSTHKQTYQSIRHSLGRCFRLVQKSKLPFAFLPDELTYYECFRCTRG